jgi:hypothetical protein
MWTTLNWIDSERRLDRAINQSSWFFYLSDQNSNDNTILLQCKTLSNLRLIQSFKCGFIHSWSWAVLEQLLIVQLLKNFPAFYGIRRFITVFTRTLHWSVSWARLIQSIPSRSLSLRYILILLTHLRFGLPSVPQEGLGKIMENLSEDRRCPGPNQSQASL